MDVGCGAEGGPALPRLLTPTVKQLQCAVQQGTNGVQGLGQEGRVGSDPGQEVQGYGREVSRLPVGQRTSSCEVLSSSVSHNLTDASPPKLHPPLSKEWLQA